MYTYSIERRRESLEYNIFYAGRSVICISRRPFQYFKISFIQSVVLFVYALCSYWCRRYRIYSLQRSDCLSLFLLAVI